MPPKKVSEFIISEKEKSLHSYITGNNYLFMTQEMHRNSVVLEISSLFLRILECPLSAA